MYSLLLNCQPADVDMLSAELWEFGTAGIREVETAKGVTLIAGFDTNNTREELMRKFASFSPQWRQEDATDWVLETERAWPARLVGQKIFLAPPWCKDATPEGRVRVIHNPGLACGTGEHPCTQLALAALETCDLKGKTVVDIGTGSGLLAIAALKLGAAAAVGLDPDEAALTAARENFLLNELFVQLAAGSADCLTTASADVVVANISGTVLLAIADEILRIIKPGGTFILTGFTRGERRTLQEVFGEGALTSSDDWCCLTVR